VEVETVVGAARVTWCPGPASPAGLVLLGHGAGGGVQAPDLQRTAQLAGELSYAVGLVEQPYRVAGRRVAAPAAQLDVAFAAVVAAARAQCELPAGDPRPLVLGGRSSGARVACRTASAAGAAGVLSLAFPLQPVRRSGRVPASRLPELAGAGVPVLVVQGERDAFGSDAAVRAALETADPAPAAPVTVLTAAGADHALRKGVPWPAVSAWLAGLLR
jgi:predicted alpha/beta-hydrolase family hydrolase